MKTRKSRKEIAAARDRFQKREIRKLERQAGKRARLAQLNHPALKNGFGEVLVTSSDLPVDNQEGLLVRVLADLPSTKVWHTPAGYLVEREAIQDVEVGESGFFNKRYIRTLHNREMALYYFLKSVTPMEFMDLLLPLIDHLEVKPGIPQANPS